MMKKALSGDFQGRFREIISDPLNILIHRHPKAGDVEDGFVTLHNGHRVPYRGEGAYYGEFSDILVLNRGVHEPLEEYVFQQLLPDLPKAPRMLELGAYWGHYSMWLKRVRPAALTHMVEADSKNLEAGRANFRRNGYEGTFEENFVATGRFSVDTYLGEDSLDILHSDIQGYEVEMLEGAANALRALRVDRLFVSTHSQQIHQRVRELLSEFSYRVEIDADFDNLTTSFDGFIFASRPDLPAVFTPPHPMGRSEINDAEPQTIMACLNDQIHMQSHRRRRV